MGSLKEILIHLQQDEKEFERYGVTSRDRDRNKGWIECCKFLLKHFDLTEKIINNERD